MLGVSRTLVYNRRKDFIECAEREGISVAAEQYDLDETFDELMELSRLLKINELSVRDAKRGAELVAVMEKEEIEDPEDFMSVVIGEAQKRDLSGEEIIRYARELRDVEAVTGKGYSKILEEIDESKEKHKDLEKTTMMLEEQVHAVRSELEKSLEEAEVTKERLVKYISSRDSLIEYGISFEELDQLAAILSNVDEMGHDPVEIIDFYGRSKALQDILESNIKKNERLKERNEALLIENDELEEKLEQNLELRTAVKSHLEAKIEAGDILDIVNSVKNMGEVLGLDERGALNRFITDVKTQYNERNGFSFRIEELKEIQRVLEEKNSLIRERLEVLEEVLEDRNRAVDSLKRLEVLEVTDSEIIEWRQLLEQQDYDVTSFRAELIKLGGMNELVKEKTADVSELEFREKALKSSILELNNRISALQATLDILRESIKSEADKIRKVVEDFESYFTSPETGFKSRSRMIVDDIVANLTIILRETRSEWDSDLESLDQTVEKVLEETDRILANAYAGGRLVGRFHSLEPIFKLLREEPVNKTEATIGVLTMLAYIKIWLGKNYPSELAESCDILIERLTRDLGEIYQQ
jgi:hypothetical protein